MDSDKFIYYVATDGGCKRNGAVNAKASWSYCIMNKYDLVREFRLIYDSRRHSIKKTSKVTDYINAWESAGILHNSTNNRGELTAILNAANRIIELDLPGKYLFITDSLLSINCIKWYPGWIKNNKLKGKKNLDLLSEITEKISKIESLGNIVEFEHVPGHENPPQEFDKWIKWYMNFRVDYFCNHPDDCGNDDLYE